MNKKRMISLVVLLAVLGVDWWYFSPKPIVEEDFEIAVVRMGTELEDVTDQLDAETLEWMQSMLSMWSYKGLPKKKTALQLTEDTISIAGTESRYVELGESGCVTYDSGSRYYYEIKDGSLLWRQLLMRMPE